MTLEIVWRNPHPIEHWTSSLGRIESEEGFRVYFVSNAEMSGYFEVVIGGAA